MRTAHLVRLLVALLVGFMAATVVIAIWQDSLGWGWWWAVPLGGGFVVMVILCRIAVQRVEERNRRLDAEEP